jgi:hypothetical protein
LRHGSSPDVVLPIRPAACQSGRCSVDTPSGKCGRPCQQRDVASDVSGIVSPLGSTSPSRFPGFPGVHLREGRPPSAKVVLPAINRIIQDGQPKSHARATERRPEEVACPTKLSRHAYRADFGLSNSPHRRPNDMGRRACPSCAIVGQLTWASVADRQGACPRRPDGRAVSRWHGRSTLAWFRRRLLRAPSVPNRGGRPIPLREGTAGALLPGGLGT